MRGISVAEIHIFIVWVGWRFVCLHFVYSGMVGRVRMNGVWPFIAYTCKVCWRTRKSMIKSPWEMFAFYILITFRGSWCSCHNKKLKSAVTRCFNGFHHRPLKSTLFRTSTQTFFQSSNYTRICRSTIFRVYTCSTSGWKFVWRIPQIFAVLISLEGRITS